MSVTDNSQLLALEGEINIVSVGRPETSAGGEVVVQGSGNQPYALQGFAERGDVTITGGTDFFNGQVTILEVSGDTGGSIVIRGGKIDLAKPPHCL